ncbi:hypothetical protein [Halococcus saccharolyticus]|uniref:hypothetical protein n=1 Tax=Halococcus saccharolyticus TaxID=62319 RepID=UPI0013757520|nr:hypothetical protein [Halococcus saccharolyticus]
MKKPINTATYMSGNKPGRTPEEQRVIDWVAEDKSEKWAEEHAELILAQARLVGEL